MNTDRNVNIIKRVSELMKWGKEEELKEQGREKENE